MRNIELLHRTEDVSLMLVYYYDVHAWCYDSKFWLVGDKWCNDLSGSRVLSKLTDRESEVIKKFTPIIEQHEKENRNWLAFQKCKKRTCICKSCSKFCQCADCKGKIKDCKEK